MEITTTEVINRGMDAHYTVHGYYPDDKMAIIWGIASYTDGRLTPGEVQSLLTEAE